MKAKGLICIVMCFCITAFGFSSVCADFGNTLSAGTAENTVVQVYAKADYDIDLRNAVYIKGYEDDGKMLTDTEYSRPFAYGDVENEGWVKIKSYDGKTDYRVSVVIDLGYIAKGINTFYSRNYQNAKKGIGFPSDVEFFVSKDGDDYTFVGNGTTMTDLDTRNDTAIFRLVTDKKFSGRYFKTVFECRGDQIFYINELCVAANAKLFRANYSEKDVITDTQGVEYVIENGVAKVSGFSSFTKNNITSVTPSDACFDQDGLVYYLGNGSDNKVKVISDFIDTDQINYSGGPNHIEYIVIHNTATTQEETDAERYNYRLHNTDDTSSWHYTVDDGVIYHSLPDSVAGWHAGPTHNYRSIGIEMCVNGAPSGKFSGERYDYWVETRFRKTMKNTAVLVAELLTRYGLDTSAVIQHYDVSEKNCPQWLRHKDGDFVHDGELWIEFMGYVEYYYEKINGKNPSHEIFPDGNVVIPDYIILRSGKVYPVSEIADNAFGNQEDFISNIELGMMISTIGKDCFEGSEGIENITVRSGNTNFYNKSGVLFNTDGDVIYDPDAITAVVPSPDEDGNLDIKKIGQRYYIFAKDEKYTLSDLEKGYGKAVKNAVDGQNNKILDKQVLGTGAVITFEDDAKLYLVVRGDADGDGKIGVNDYVLTKRMYFGTFHGNKRQIFAVALSNGESITMIDYVLLKRHYFGTYNIMQ